MGRFLLNSRLRLSISLTIILTMAITITAFAEVTTPKRINTKVNGIILSTTQKANPVQNKVKKTITALVKKTAIKKVVVKKTAAASKHIPTKAEISKLPIDLSDLYKIKDGLGEDTFLKLHRDMLDFLNLPVSFQARLTYNTDANGLNNLMVKMANEYMNKILDFDYKKGINYYTNLTKTFYSINSKDNFIYAFKKQIEFKVVSEGLFYTKEDLTYNASGALVRGKVRIIFHSGTKDYFESNYGKNLKINQWYEIPYEVDVPADGADALRHTKVNGVNILKNYIKEFNVKK